MKKLIISTVIFGMLSLNGSLALAKEQVTDPSLYEVEASDAQINAYYESIGETRPSLPRTFKTAADNDIIEDLVLVKEESTSDIKGNVLSETRYYKYNLKDTDTAKFIKNTIENETSSTLNSLNNTDVAPYAFTPSEGDFRIHMVYNPLEVTTKFDSSTKNYMSAFTIETYSNVFTLGTGYIESHPIVSFFIGDVLDDLLSGSKGSGDATGYQRLVYKYGQVYHNGQWKSYYETYQRETFWKHETFSYNSNGSLKNATTNYYLPATGGTSYWPFMWIRTGSFSKNTEIADVALIQYAVEPNRSTPALDFYRYEGGLENWATQGSFPY